MPENSAAFCTALRKTLTAQADPADLSAIAIELREHIPPFLLRRRRRYQAFLPVMDIFRILPRSRLYPCRMNAALQPVCDHDGHQQRTVEQITRKIVNG
jgi:hypothetical protein